MPTKFRFLPDLSKPDPQGTGSQPLSGTTSEDSLPDFGSPIPLSLAPPEPLQVVPEENESTGDRKTVSGLHDIIKNTDISFNYSLSALEKAAVLSAGQHAQAGLPRQQAAATEELTAEAVLRGRAAELFLDWASRVRRRTQDAIQSSCVLAGEGIIKLRHELDELEFAAGRISEAALVVRGFESETAGQEKTLEYGSLLHKWQYYLLAAGLVVVDWVANVPVFTQLLPSDPGSDQRWADLVSATERFGATAGLHNLWNRVVFSPEVSMLALGVVTFLMFLGHVNGQSVRQLVAFWPKNEGKTVVGLQAYRRQAWYPAVASLIGIILVVSFLFMSRASIKVASRARLDEATQQVADLTSTLQVQTNAGSTEAPDTSAKLQNAQELVKDRSTSYNYASGISAMNGPICLLNIVLAIVAASAAYLQDKRLIRTSSLADPRLAPLEAKLELLRSEAESRKHNLRVIDSDIQTNLAQSRYLSQAFPLRDWSAKARRLETVIQLFRTENARQRGIDVQNILAFQVQRPLQLPDIRENEPFDIPAELPVWEGEFERLRKQMDAVDSRLSQALSPEVRV